MISIRNATMTLTGGQSDVISESKYAGQQRLTLEIANLAAAGGNDIFVSIGQEAAANKGRRIQPGQSIIWSTDGGYRPPNEQVTAYSAGADAIAIYEEIAVRD